MIMISLFLQVMLAFVAIMIGDLSFLLDGYNVVAFIIYAFVFSALLILRVTHKEAPRPFKVSQCPFSCVQCSTIL